ncbi:MAG: hypothetical protein WC241_01315 [Candidatus Paceibacterota bacterium]|jgi:hypothetical protein
MDFSQLFPKDLYHSYVVEGNPEEIVYLLRIYLEERGDINKRSPDVLLNLYDAFNIEDGHNIKDWHKNKGVDGKKKVCIIGAKFINREAEQSLLKIIEEPMDDTHFFIVVPDASLLAETILSRVHLIKNLKRDNNFEDKIAGEFIKANPKERIEKVAEIIKEFKDNENSGGLRYYAISLVNGIERIVYEKWKKDLNNKDFKFILNELKNCRGFLSTPGAAVKMILEHIALVI